MTLFPEVQDKARQEIDAVTEGHRLPDFDDRPRMQYCERIFREIHRWQAMVGVPTHPVDMVIQGGIL